MLTKAAAYFLCGSDLHTEEPSSIALIRVSDDHAHVLRVWPGFTSPSYVVPHPSGRFFASTNETRDGGFTLVDATTSHLSRCMSRPPGTALPCHITFDATGALLATANYDSANVSIMELSDGQILATRKVSFAGDGPHPRQNRSHPHMCRFVGNDLWVSDLGADIVWILHGPDFRARSVIHLPAGFGPRHFVVRDGAMTVVGELAVSVAHFVKRGLRWHLTNVAATTAAAKAAPGGLDLSPEGDSVIVTNRGANTLSLIDLPTPSFTDFDLRWEVPSGAQDPRAVAWVGPWIAVAHQVGGEISIFKVESSNRAPCVAVARLPWPGASSVEPLSARIAESLLLAR